MRTLMGQAHRERILKSVSPGSRILEWGSGGSTLWLADRLPAGAFLTSIDHDPVWHERVKAKLGERDNVRLLISPPTGAMGANATIEEESAAPVQDYIHAMDGETFDVILVDGVARNACLDQARRLLSPGGIVFLHDAHRSWYDEGKSLFVEFGTMGSCPEYPGPLLWWGGLEPERPRYSAGALPIVVSFFTSGTDYEREAEKLQASLNALNMEAEIIGVPSLGTWERTCAFKARFIRDAYFRLNRPILWLDADAVVEKLPLLLSGAEPDFAVHRCAGWQFASGTVYFNSTALGQQLLETWVAHCESNPDIWDQIHLDRAWEEVTARYPLYTLWLPQSYAKIFDRPWEMSSAGEGPVIEHFQASRRLKTSVGSEPPKIMRDPSPVLVAARRACRPREDFYDQRFVLNDDPAAPDPWAISPSNSPEGKMGSKWANILGKLTRAIGA